MGKLIEKISAPVIENGKRFRALRASDPADLALFKAVTDGRFTINGFRNRDLQTMLFLKPPASEKEKRQRTGKVSRLIRLLRAHHLVKRVSNTYRYLLTQRGAEILRSILSMTHITLAQLKQLAA